MVGYALSHRMAMMNRKTASILGWDLWYKIMRSIIVIAAITTVTIIKSSAMMLLASGRRAGWDVRCMSGRNISTRLIDSPSMVAESRNKKTV